MTERGRKCRLPVFETADLTVERIYTPRRSAKSLPHGDIISNCGEYFFPGRETNKTGMQKGKREREREGPLKKISRRDRKLVPMHSAAPSGSRDVRAQRGRERPQAYCESE